MLDPLFHESHIEYPSISESQIMNTLNSSIDDLLSKISKVQHEYQVSTRQPSQNSLTAIENDQQCLSQCELNRYFNECNTSTLNSSKHLFSQGELMSRESNAHPSERLSFNVYTNLNLSMPHKIQNLSLKLIQSEIPQNPLSLKSIKIHSLFDTSVIKEVASSQIFTNQQPDQQQQNLLLKTREVQQIIISTPNSSPTKIRPANEGISLSQFEVGASVGSGKFGQVYLCRHRQTGFLFALKKIFKSTIKEYGIEAQFCMELKLLYMLDHPNVVKLYGHFSDDYHVFLLMEYMEGGQLLAKLGSDEKYVARVMEPLLEVVEHLHNQQIIHRDIKPENVVLAFDHTPKLCDFGWATKCRRDHMRQTYCGTLDYLSPEMKESGVYTCRVDLWSLGILTYELLTGSAPFKEQITQWKKKGSKRSDPWNWHISYPPSISALAQNFMSNLLRENPDERASLHSCKNHFFIRKYKPMSNQIKKQVCI